MISVTPQAGLNSIITADGVAVIAVGPGPNGGIITNPYTNTDQGLADAEVLYVSPVSAPGLSANGTAFALYPGQSWTLIPGQTTPTYVNAATNGHKFSVVWY